MGVALSVEQKTAAPPWARDRFTLTAYLALGFFMLSRSVLAPFIAYRSAEDPGAAGLLGVHVTIAAAGIIAAGMFWNRLGAGYSRRTTVPVAALLLALGALGLGATVLAVSFAAAFLLGAAGSVLNITLQSALSDRHGANRRIALGEAAVVSSLFGALAPFAIAACSRVPFLGWRSGLVLPLLLLACFLPLLRTTPMPEKGSHQDPDAPRHGGNLPRVFRAWVGLLFLCSATEWAVIYWGASFLHGAAGIPVQWATMALGLFLGVEILGKALWSFLSRRAPVERLMTACTLAALLGITALIVSARSGWPPVVPLAALMVFGFGISGTTQLATAAALALPRSLSTLAMSRVSLAAGLSVVLFPLLLGLAAQTAGITDAFFIPAATCLLAVAASAVLGFRAGRKHD
ncbi:sugar MFS transporter [Arthrobacter sp. GN70]|uniref:MFS transporter n=1 Tax=Arthrobacter sp. GN70 TaxID=2838876 RepID=UPI001BFE673B|nr:MFS transporter [Arthrobacter sp. GN70]MBT8162610.1 MFS transporter [Arthrobacter sp. GN70]